MTPTTTAARMTGTAATANRPLPVPPSMPASAPAWPRFAQWARSTLLLDVPASSVRVRVGVVVAIVIGAGTIAASGAIHLHLWSVGYRHVPRIGPLFLAQSVSGFVLAVLIVVSRRMFAVLAGAVFQAASVFGLLLSATVGFLGLHDGLSVPWATESIIVELIGFVVLVGCALTMLLRR